MDPTTTTATTGPGKTLTHFPLFGLLPPEIRQQIWTLAFFTLLHPSRSSSTPETAPRPLHIRPFNTLTLPPHLIPLMANLPAHLYSKFGPHWRDDPHAQELYRQGQADCAKTVASAHSTLLEILDMPRDGGPAGTPLGIGRYDSGWLVADEAARIAGSCAEAKRLLGKMTFRLGAPEQWVDPREGVCCFWDQDAAAGPVGHDGWRHPVLVPGLTLKEALILDDGRPAYDWNGKYGMIRGNRRVVAAAAHCEELAVMWSPDYCLDIGPGIDPLEQPECEAFNQHLVDLVTRHPKLHTLYVLDPMVAPAGLYAPGGNLPKFRGDGASFYEIDCLKTDGWLTPVPSYGAMKVFIWAMLLERQLSTIKEEAEGEGHIQVKVLACVPDLNIRAATTLVEGFLRPDVFDDQTLLLGMAFWVGLIGLAVVARMA